MVLAIDCVMTAPTDLRRDWAECRAEGVSPGYQYANQFEVGFSRNEVLLRMTQAYEGEGLNIRPTRVVMTPPYAKALLQLLSEAVLRYESEYGAILAAGAGVLPDDGAY